MSLRNTENKYGVVAKAFHWGMALLIICMLIMGLKMSSMPIGADKLRLYGLHKSTGVLILFLVCLRLMWRFTNPAPRLPDSMPRIQKLAADASHWALYGLMFAMPISGWMMSSAAGFPVSFYGLFVMPNLVGADSEFMKLMGYLHWLMGYALIGLLTLHVGAALHHHFIHRDNVLRRMLPWSRV